MVWAVGGQGDLREVTQLLCKLESWFFFKSHVFWYNESFGTIARGLRWTWRAGTACMGCRRSKRTSGSNSASMQARDLNLVHDGFFTIPCLKKSSQTHPRPMAKLESTFQAGLIKTFHIRGHTKLADSFNKRFLSVWGTTHPPTLINAQASDEISENLIL